MAYAVKYQLLCKGRDGITTRLVISEDGYAGAEIDRDVPTSPFNLRKDSAEVIQGTSMEFRIREVVDFEFMEFYTNNPKKYKIEFHRTGSGLTADSTEVSVDDTTHTADEMGTSIQLWSGYLNPQQYTCKYAGGGQNISFQATDGLGLLKAESFTFTGVVTQFEIIRHCIDKIGLNLGYAIAIGLHEENHNTSYPPITQTYEDAQIYSEKSCYEVLEDILGKYDATITQCRNRWQIITYKDKKLTRCLYTYAGVYEGTEAVADVLLLDLVNEAAYVRPSGYLTLSLSPGGKSIRLVHDYGRKDSFLKNHDFEQYHLLSFDDWIRSGTFTPTQLIINGKYAAYLTGYSNVDTDYIGQSISVTNIVGQGFVFEVDFAAVGHTVSNYTLGALSMEVRMLVTLNVSGTLWYLTSTGWSTTPGYIAETVTSAIFAPGIVFSTIRITTYGLPGSGTLTVRLQRYKHANPGSGTVYSGVAFSEVKVYFLKNGELYPDKYDKKITFTESSEPAALADEEIFIADAPDETNAALLYRNVMTLSDDSLTSAWIISGIDANYPLVLAYAQMLASRNRVARQKLTGTIKGSALYFDSIIKHEYNSDREFEIYECSWDVYEGKWNVTLVEWLSYSDELIQIE